MQQKPQYLEIVMEKGGKEKHYGTQKTKRESDWGEEETNTRVSRKKGSNDHKVNEA